MKDILQQFIIQEGHGPNIEGFFARIDKLALKFADIDLFQQLCWS